MAVAPRRGCQSGSRSDASRFALHVKLHGEKLWGDKKNSKIFHILLSMEL